MKTLSRQIFVHRIQHIFCWCTLKFFRKQALFLERALKSQTPYQYSLILIIAHRLN